VNVPSFDLLRTSSRNEGAPSRPTNKDIGKEIDGTLMRLSLFYSHNKNSQLDTTIFNASSADIPSCTIAHADFTNLVGFLC
jgi:hypothetical protein